MNTNPRLTKLERHLKEDFKSLQSELQAYFHEETLNPDEILYGNYQKTPISKKAVIITKVENWIRQNCHDNDNLIRAQAYLGSVAQYFLELANSNVEKTLRAK